MSIFNYFNSRKSNPLYNNDTNEWSDRANLLSGLTQVASPLMGSVIGGGYDSSAGDTIGALGSGIGTAVSIVNPIAGAAISLGSNVLGGLTSRAFGTKLNQGNINRIESNIDALNAFNANASTFDGLSSLASSRPTGISFSKRDIGKDGWFSHKASRKYNSLLEAQNRAEDWANRSITNNAESLIESQRDNLLANYAAFGGLLDLPLVSGAIDYELAQRRLAQKDLEIQEKNKLDVGGPLHTHGADFSNGIIEINNGGSHESNPLEGVPMGVDEDGQPNLVEEGEVIFNNYVFSNRLKVPNAVREKYKLRGVKDMTFADAAKKAQKESEERPNDPISQRGLEDIMGKLMYEQELIRQNREDMKYAKGGDIHIKPSKRGTFTAEASKHSMGVQEFASKVLANPDNYSPAMRKKANFARNASKWKHSLGGNLFPDGGILPMSEYNLPNLPLVSLGEAERIKMSDDELKALNDIKVDMSSTNKNKSNKSKYNPITALRYAPAVGAGIGVLSDLFGWTNRPDYSNADLVIDAANSIGDVRYTPIGDYLRYTPLDRLFYSNQLGAQTNATRRGILNNSGLNRGVATAGLLASDYNAQSSLGNLYRQAEEYNLGQRERVATFNRGTNMFNAENDLKAQMANRENAKIRVDAAAKAAAIRDAVDSRVGAARSANLTNLFDSLGNIGREEVMKSWINKNPGLLYDISLGGRGVKYGLYKDGGLLTIKRKKRRK